MSQIQHDVPKCQCCGTITHWKLEPILLPIHIIVGLALLLFFGSGIIYVAGVAAIRANPVRRAKICPRCGGRNLWTFLY